ncbi:small-conductance mechanosensitive channel [Hanstruepera neustonica]|uniref:Small-conductance mechanosensitive channel n=1 Tax=Hanstruepera neustonica TaxID=1445657 RepID=A0A2K1DWB6_9FLAO|nr:small-conductance mechanosensitive channel [Hanstruepera neustonica]PNQ72307.1 small-conductance mechanosensitive channel [Hanstruepera neustonica]
MKKDINFNLLEELMQNVYDFLPRLVFGILFVLATWLLLKLILFIVKKSLKLTKINYLSEKLNNVPFLNSEFKIDPEKIILVFVKWFFILIFIIIGAEILNFDLVSNEVGKLIHYLPRFFGALLIFVLGIYGANYLKKTLRTFLKAVDINGSKAISNILFIVLVVMVSIMALNQAGFDTDIITNNLFLILGAILASFTIAFGFGSRDIVYRLLLGFYSRRNFAVGQKILIDEKEGIIKGIDNISMIVVFDGRKVVYPIKYITNKKIEIID